MPKWGMYRSQSSNQLRQRHSNRFKRHFPQGAFPSLALASASLNPPPLPPLLPNPSLPTPSIPRVLPMSELRTKKDYQTALLRLKIQLPPRNCTLRELQELYNNATREEVTPVRSRAAASSTMRQSAPLPLPREVSSRRPKRSLAEGTASPAPNRKRASTPATAHPARTVPPDISPRVSPPPPPPPYPPPPIHPPPSRLNERTSRQSFGNVALNEQQASDNRRTSRRSFGNVPLSQQSPSAVVAPAPQQQPAARRSFGNIPLNQQSLRPRPIDSMEELPSFNFAEDPIPPPAEAEASNFSRLRGLLASLTSSRLLKLAITPVVLVLALAIASMLPTSVLPPTPTHPQLAAPDGAEPPGQMERLAMKLSPSALYQVGY